MNSLEVLTNFLKQADEEWYDIDENRIKQYNNWGAFKCGQSLGYIEGIRAAHDVLEHHWKTHPISDKENVNIKALVTKMFNLATQPTGIQRFNLFSWCRYRAYFKVLTLVDSHLIQKCDLL